MYKSIMLLMNTESNLNEEFKNRLEKLNGFKRAGFNPYPERFEKKHEIRELLEYAENNQIFSATEINRETNEFVTAGRIMTLREHGKITFANLQDFTGKIQISFSQNILGSDLYSLIKFFDLGDFIGVTGKIFKTNKGEITLMVYDFSFLGKAYRQLPEKFHGLKDREILYRQRYLDLLVNPDTKKRFIQRSNIINFLRNYLLKNKFFEVETPILTPTASGALAKPFITHHNALDTDFYLRIAPETYLKRLIVGGYEKVFEFAKCFRNEGIDPSHLQEFTMLEYYVAYWNWEDNKNFTEKLVSELVFYIFGKYKINLFGKELDFTPPFPVITMRDVIWENSKIDINNVKDKSDLLLKIKKAGINLDNTEKLGLGNLIDSLYKKVARDKIIKPTFLINHPISLSPLARANDFNKNIADRFQLIVNGWEIVNAYSELVDPLEQKQRLIEQNELKNKGDEEAMMMDDDYIKAMEYGMPPISGWGMGIDRLCTLFSEQENLKDVVLFPLLKNKNDLPTNVLNDQISDPGISYEEAVNLLNKYIPPTDPLYKHSLAVEFIMRSLADKLKQNQTVWGIAGLLHDLDYLETKEQPHLHGIKSEKILQDHGLHPEIIYAIKAHNYLHELSLHTLLAKALYSVEELAGLITACALVQPDKSLSSVTLDSLLKKIKQKSFASGVNRSIIIKSEEYLNMSLKEVMSIALQAMQNNSKKLGL